MLVVTCNIDVTTNHVTGIFLSYIEREWEGPTLWLAHLLIT